MRSVCAKSWPGETLTLLALRAKAGSRIRMLGRPEDLAWSQDAQGLKIVIPARYQDPKNRPCELAWVFQIEPEAIGNAQKANH